MQIKQWQSPWKNTEYTEKERENRWPKNEGGSTILSTAARAIIKAYE